MTNSDNNQSQFIIYQIEDGAAGLDVRFLNGTICLTKKIMAELFQTSASNIGMHLANKYRWGTGEKR